MGAITYETIDDVIFMVLELTQLPKIWTLVRHPNLVECSNDSYLHRLVAGFIAEQQ